MSDKRIVSMAVELRNASDDFTGRESPDDVVEKVLEKRLATLTEEGRKASEKQAELRAKFGLDDGDGEEAELSEAEQRQNDVRDRLNL